MSINLQRAERKTEHFHIPTPHVVGPGTYNPKKNPREARENVAPFNSMRDRDGNGVTENPGPGTYAAEKVKVVATVKDKMSNSFSTKIPRFCPTAPGSSSYKPPSYLTNPGPGTHYKSLRFTGLPSDLDQSRAKYYSNKHRDAKSKPGPHAPSIPSKKANVNMYTGRGFDTVGPALYNPNINTIKGRAPIGDFQTSKQDRKLFEPNIEIENKLPSRENPGPGQYDGEKAIPKRNFNSQKNKDSIFLSRVPNCKDSKIKNDKPGPGEYVNVFPATTAGTTSTADSTMRESQFGASTTSGGKQNLNPFMSTTHRTDFWRNELNAPFTKQTYLVNPGPGAYAVNKKKGDDIKTRLLQEETVQVAFQQQEERECNKDVKAPNPGPGAYIDINNPNNSSICKSLAKIKEDRTLAESQGVKLGVFGSNTSRFDNSWIDVKHDYPGPGTYDIQSHVTKPTIDLTVTGKSSSVGRMETTLTQERGMSNAIFRSSVDRFSASYSAKNPGIRILRSTGGVRSKLVAQSDQGKHVYDKEAILGVENQVTCMKDGNSEWKQQKTRASDFESNIGKKVGFDATSPRFNYNQVFYGTSLKLEVPGPGLYKDTRTEKQRPRTMNQPRAKNLKYAVVFNTSERRFRPKASASIYNQPGTQPIIGPGSYINNENSMVKKSFNMSMENSYFV